MSFNVLNGVANMSLQSLANGAVRCAGSDHIRLGNRLAGNTDDAVVVAVSGGEVELEMGLVDSARYVAVVGNAAEAALDGLRVELGRLVAQSSRQVLTVITQAGQHNSHAYVCVSGGFESPSDGVLLMGGQFMARLDGTRLPRLSEVGRRSVLPLGVLSDEDLPQCATEYCVREAVEGAAGVFKLSGADRHRRGAVLDTRRGVVRFNGDEEVELPVAEHHWARLDLLAEGGRVRFNCLELTDGSRLVSSYRHWLRELPLEPPDQVSGTVQVDGASHAVTYERLREDEHAGHLKVVVDGDAPLDIHLESV